MFDFQFNRRATASKAQVQKAAGKQEAEGTSTTDGAKETKPLIPVTLRATLRDKASTATPAAHIDIARYVSGGMLTCVLGPVRREV